MLARLERAKQGDEAAHAEVALYTFNKYRHRIGKLYSLDPAICKEDLEMTFFEAIMKMIPRLDHRGNPFYRAGQQGWWAVASELRTIKQMLDRRAVLTRTADDADWLDRLEDRLEPDFREGVVTRLQSASVVKAITSSSLKAPAQRALAFIYSGKVGEPGELGFNKKLAEAMGCSPQRVSQIMNELRAIGHGSDTILPWEDA